MDAGRLSPESTFEDGTKEAATGGNNCGTLSPSKADSYLSPSPIWAMGHFSEKWDSGVPRFVSGVEQGGTKWDTMGQG